MQGTTGSLIERDALMLDAFARCKPKGLPEPIHRYNGKPIACSFSRPERAGITQGSQVVRLPAHNRTIASSILAPATNSPLDLIRSGKGAQMLQPIGKALIAQRKDKRSR